MFHEKLKYDGVRLIWRATDKPAGCSNGRYICIRLAGKTYLAHRVIWFMQTGNWPDEIDHINRDGMDNRWENLREVNRSGNMRNRGAWNKEGLPKGISRSGNGYRGSVGINGQLYQTKTFYTIEDTVKARNALQTRLLSIPH